MGWQRRGQEPTQQHQRARHVRGSDQKRSRNQSKPNARSGEAITAAQADSADTALVGRGGGGGYDGARSAERRLQRGEKPRQRYEHAADVQWHHQTCSEDQSRRAARSGTTITTAEREHA